MKLSPARAAEIVQYVNDHVRVHGCRFENGRWRHFCGKKDHPRA
jgi:hypothetical protein